MSSDLFVFDNTFFSDPFSPFSDTHIDPQNDLDFFQSFPDDFSETVSNCLIQENPTEETNSQAQTASALLSSSPPSHQLESLSICKEAQLHNASSDSVNGFSEYSVKTEECQVPFDSVQGYSNHSYNAPQTCGNDDSEDATKFMQRSFSSSSFDNKRNFLFQPRFDPLLESPNLRGQQVPRYPENSFTSGHMRRVCSTGDIQKIRTTPASNILSSSPLSSEKSFIEEANFKVGRYSAEERKERIHRYRAKRTQRNFNKTIKYACRKTLADNRPRIRGRFARNDEAGEIPKAAMFNSKFEDEDDLWVDGGFHEEEEEVSIGVVKGEFFNSYGSTHHQYHHYYSF